MAPDYTPTMLRTPASPLLRRFGLLGLLTLCIALPAQAQWKWKDAAGKVQYSDLPPPNGTPDKDILQRPPGQRLQVIVLPPAGSASVAAAPAAAPSAPSRAELERQKLQEQQEQQKQAKQKEEERRVAQQKRENCGRAQDQLKLLQDGVRLTRPNERGENVVLDERMRAEEMQRARTVMGSECR